MVSRTEESSLSKDKKFCECGCGTIISIRDKYGQRRRYVNGHQLLGRKTSPEKLEKMRIARLKLIAQGKMKGKNHPSWKGGRYLDAAGYVRVWVGDSHPRANKGTVREHVLVMEQHLGRYLEPHELAHHKDENKQNNDISNLLLTTKSEHRKIHGYVDTSSRFCVLCNQKTYVESDGHQGWYKYQDGFICKKCYRKRRNK